VIEINDSMVHDLDPDSLLGTVLENGQKSLCLAQPLIIRAADYQRPIVRLAKPLGFRPQHMPATDLKQEEKNALKAEHDSLTVRLEGLFITRAESFPAGKPLIARAALHKLEIVGCTIDPLPAVPDPSAAKMLPALGLDEDYGVADPAARNNFTQVPEIELRRTVSGPLAIDPAYRLAIVDSVIDAGGETKKAESDCDYAVTGTGNSPGTVWGPETEVRGATFFGRMRVERICGQGGIWVHCLQVLDRNRGCLKYCYFPDVPENLLPQNHGCVNGKNAQLSFTSDRYGNPGFAQLRLCCDLAIRERGPNDDAMGAFGFMLEAHKWRNLFVRFREFLPAGIRPIFIPIT
jgi:hypothetical protein